jgi:hypothetical protein
MVVAKTSLSEGAMWLVVVSESGRLDQSAMSAQWSVCPKVDAAERFTRVRALVPFEEDVVLPAAHAQQDLADERDVVPVVRIDRDLGLRPHRDLIF